jgi:hypothetical protein
MGYKIWTNDGWKPFEGVRKIVGKNTIKITLENGKEIVCTEDHKIYKNVFECSEAKSYKVNDYVYTVDGMIAIKHIENVGVNDVYDILQVDDGNKFFANDILVHNCEFIGQSNSLIDTSVIRNLLLDLQNVTYKFLVDNDVRFYCDINPWQKYFLAIDTSMGVEGDFAAIQLFAFPSMEQVAEWQSDKLNQNMQIEKVKAITDWLYAKIRELGNRFPEIYWSLENNGSAEGFICALNEKGGVNYIKRAKLITERNNKRIGFTTTRTTKPAACSQLKILIESNKLKIYSREYAVQLSNFSAKSAQSYSANGTTHDDLISASLIMIMMYLQERFSLDLKLEVFSTYNFDKNKERQPKYDMPFYMDIH